MMITTEVQFGPGTTLVEDWSLKFSLALTHLGGRMISEVQLGAGLLGRKNDLWSSVWYRLPLWQNPEHNLYDLWSAVWCCPSWAEAWSLEFSLVSTYIVKEWSSEFNLAKPHHRKNELRSSASSSWTSLNSIVQTSQLWKSNSPVLATLPSPKGRPTGRPFL